MAAQAPDHRRDFGTAAWLLVALILQIGASRWRAPDVVSVDYFTLWAVPSTLPWVPDRNIYSPDNQRLMANAARLTSMSAGAPPAQQIAQRFSDSLYDGRIDATGSPLAYAIVGLASSGHYDIDLDRFTVASFIAFIVSIGLLCKLLGFPPTLTVIVAVAYGMCFSPVLAELRVGNVNQLQLLVLSVFLWLGVRGHTAAAGAVLGAGIMFKPNIVAVLVVAVLAAVVNGRLRQTGQLLAGVSAGAAAAVLAGAAYFGTFSVWGDFLRSIRRTLQLGYPLDQGNFALSSIIATLTGAEVSLLLTAFVMTVVLAVLARRRSSAAASLIPVLDEQFLIVGIGCAAMLLGSRLVWIHYYVLLIPLSLYLLRPRPPAEREPFGPVAAGLALLLLSPAAQVVSNLALHVAVMANVATLAVFAAGLHAWRSGRDGAAKATPYVRQEPRVRT